jgi:hypothetical protein
MSPINHPDTSPKETSDYVAKTFFHAGEDQASQKKAIRRLLLSAVAYAGIIPLLFYLRFGEVGGLGWGITIFFVAYCLLAATGIYFRSRKEYHTSVQLRGDWVDRLGSFWLMSCVFGPLLGWFVTSAFPLMADSWRWLYGLRMLLAMGLPILTALSLTRYVRGKAAWVALPLLVIVTLLPILSVMNIGRDLWVGPRVQQSQMAENPELYLPYSKQFLDNSK